MSTVNWKLQVLNCPWPLLSSLVLSCPVLELVSINASFAFARIHTHSHSHKQEEQTKKKIHRMLLNAIKNNITRMRGIKLLWFQKNNTTYYMGWHIHAYHIYIHICAIYGISIFIKITPQCANVAERRELHCQFNLFASSFCCFYCCYCCWCGCGFTRHVLNECHRISRQ